MKFGEVHHIALSVRDLDASIAFYEGLLGLRKTLTMNVGGGDTQRGLRLRPGMRGRAAYVQGPTRIGQLELIQWDTPLDADATPRRPWEAGVFLIAFELDEGELTEVHERLLAASVECYTEPRRSLVENFGHIDVMVCEDPDGNMIELLRLPKPDEIRAYRESLGLMSASRSAD
jgi:lactoylglutathione lyase